MDESKSADEKPRTFSETIEVAGSQVIDQVKRVIREGNVRQLKITAKDSDFSLEMPMTVGVLIGGAVALTAPWLAVLGVIAGFVTILAFQGFVVDSIGLPAAIKTIAFPWQLCIGTAVATVVCLLGKPRKTTTASIAHA